jgi:hypothetical protein
MITPVALTAAWLSICGVSALGLSTLLNRRPRYDGASHREADRLGCAAQISRFHGDRNDR